MRKIELLRRGELEDRLRSSLQERVMPDYFLYLGDEGVKNWLTLDSSPEFPIASRLTNLLAQNIHPIAQHISGLSSVVSIGVGNGVKERILLEALISQGITAYYAIDVSSEMVDEALSTVRHIKLKKTGIVAFLEEIALFQKFWDHPILLCLLGNNFCNYEPEFLLETVYQQLDVADLFLFDCHLLAASHKNNLAARKQIERTYRSPTNISFNINPLVKRGLDPQNCVFKLELLPVETSVGHAYKTSKRLVILEDTIISCNQDKVLLAAGDTIQMGFTYKYTCSQVQEALRRHHFQEVGLFQDPQRDNLLVLARKKLPTTEG